MFSELVLISVNSLIQKRPLDGGKQGIPVKMVKKDKLVNMVGKNVRSETSAVSVAPRVKPELTLPTTYKHDSLTSFSPSFSVCILFYLYCSVFMVLYVLRDKDEFPAFFHISHRLDGEKVWYECEMCFT